MDRAHQQTDEELARLERRIRRLYTQAEQDLEEKLNAHMDKFRAKDAFFRRQLQDGKITEDQYKSWRAGQIFTGKRWQAKLDSMTAALAQTNELALSLINSQLPGVFANNANWLAYSLEEGAGVNFGFDLYDEATVARLIREQPRLLPDRKLDIPKDKKWSKTKIAQQITQGIIQGERLDQIATRLQTVTGMERVYALTNARTAMTGAQNAGRQERMREAEGMGIKLHKVWLSTLDGHTRTEHARLDGQKRPVDEPFEIDGYKIRYPGDPSALPAMVYNCRCTTITDLDDYPDEFDTPRYDNIEGKPIKGMTFEEWAEAKQPGLYRKHFEGWQNPEAKNGKPKLKEREIIPDGLPDFIHDVIGYKSEPYSIEDAVENVNLENYKKGFSKEYHWNCQRCVSAYELRRRGYNVEALPFDGKYPDWDWIFKNKTSDYDNWVAGSHNYFYGRWDHNNPYQMGRGAKGAVKSIEEAMERWGNGSRAVLSVAWKGCNSSHIINVENVNGIVTFIDSQCGKIISGHEALLNYMQRTTAVQSCLVRIDNKEIWTDQKHSKIAQAIRKKDEK